MAIGAPLNTATQQSPRRQGLQHCLQVIGEGFVVVVCTLALILTPLGIRKALLETDAPETRDFVDYWASGQQLVHHLDPYDIDAIARLKAQSLGATVDILLLGHGGFPALRGPEADEV